MKKRVFHIILAAAILLTMAAPALAADTAASGRCGETARWSLSGDGTLTISGTGIVDPLADESWYGLAERATKLVIRPGITGILTSAFGGFSMLRSISLPNTLTTTVESTFSYCNGITDVTIPGSWSVGWGDFAGCGSLRSVTIREGSRSIGSCAFSSCPELSRVSLPSTMNTIGTSAFDSCTKLAEITLPAGVREVGMDAFRGCEVLQSITVLNPKCEIAPSNITLGIPGVTTICGYSGSTAQAYAKRYGFAFCSLGIAPAGWVDADGQRYYYQDGERLKGVWIIHGQRYFFSLEDGHMVKGQIVTAENGKQYYASSKDGHILRGGLLTVGGRQYYASSRDGHLMKGGLVTGTGGKQYYVSAKDGHVMKGGWINAGGGRAYLAGADGVIIEKR